MEAVGGAILQIGWPVESYVVLDPDLIVKPSAIEGPILVHRRLVTEPGSGRRVPVNRNQAWTAAAIVYFAALLAAMDNMPLVDG